MEKEIWPWEGHQCIVQGLAVPFRRKSNSASNWTISTSARHHSTAQINGKRFIVAAARYIDAGIFPDAVLLAGLLCQNPYSKTPQLRLSKSLCLLQGTLKWTKIPMFFRWKNIQQHMVAHHQKTWSTIVNYSTLPLLVILVVLEVIVLVVVALVVLIVVLMYYSYITGLLSVLLVLLLLWVSNRSPLERIVCWQPFLPLTAETTPALRQYHQRSWRPHSPREHGEELLLRV
jgi:hypothetical protein